MTVKCTGLLTPGKMKAFIDIVMEPVVEPSVESVKAMIDGWNYSDDEKAHMLKKWKESGRIPVPNRSGNDEENNDAN